MNSRGTLMTHRITGETLAISDSVAMTRRGHPAEPGSRAAPRARRSEGHRPRGYSVKLWNAYARQARNYTCRLLGGARGPIDASGLLNCPARPSPAKSRGSKWSPTPTVGHEVVLRLSGPVTGTRAVLVLHQAGGFGRDRSAPGPA